MSEPNVGAIKSGARARMSTRSLTTLAMLTAIAYVVMILSKMLPQVANFLQMDLKDTVICIGGFLFGPLSAAIISIVVAVVEMFTVSDTGPIGCIMNVLATCAFTCTAAFVYKKFHTRKRRRHRPGPGHRVPDCGDAAVELPDHPHLYGNGS